MKPLAYEKRDYLAYLVVAGYLALQYRISGSRDLKSNRLTVFCEMLNSYE